jgi:hypothetical protein
MHQLTDFFRKHNLRPFMVGYLAVVHLLAVIGMVYNAVHPHTLLKVISRLLQVLAVHVLFHLLYALGITGGAHRLWAHKTYHASSPLKLFLMLLCSGKPTLMKAPTRARSSTGLATTASTTSSRTPSSTPTPWSGASSTHIWGG